MSHQTVLCVRAAVLDKDSVPIVHYCAIDTPTAGSEPLQDARLNRMSTCWWKLRRRGADARRALAEPGSWWKPNEHLLLDFLRCLNASFKLSDWCKGTSTSRTVSVELMSLCHDVVHAFFDLTRGDKVYTSSTSEAKAFLVPGERGLCKAP